MGVKVWVLRGVSLGVVFLIPAITITVTTTISYIAFSARDLISSICLPCWYLVLGFGQLHDPIQNLIRSYPRSMNTYQEIDYKPIRFHSKMDTSMSEN